MKIVWRINFIEKENNKKSDWYLDSSLYATKNILTDFKVILKELPSDLKQIENRLLFYKFKNIIFYINDTNQLKLEPQKKKKHLSEMSIEYLLDVIKYTISDVDIAKILALHFSFIVFASSQDNRNLINNFVKSDNTNVLSSGKQLILFKRSTPDLTIIQDSLIAKKKKYFTPIKFRDK